MSPLLHASQVLARPLHPSAEESDAERDAAAVEEFLRTADPAPFTALVERYHRAVFRLVAGILGPERMAETEDVTQEVFLIVHQRLRSFRREGSFAAWLFRIAKYRAIDELRKPVSKHSHGDLELLDGVAASLEGARARVQRRELWEALSACLRTLPPTHRAAVHLHYWLGCDTEEIASMLGISRNTVKSHLHRARHRLGRCLTRKGWSDES